jgi:ABC-type Fe3+/spermidine/putrescine transport system ATPase subunit
VVLEGRARREAGRGWIDLVDGGTRLILGEDHCGCFTDGNQVRVISRPEDIDILPMGETGVNQAVAKIDEVAYLGDHIEYNVSAGGRSFVLSAGKKARYQVGSQVRLAFDPERLTVLAV